MNVREIVKDSLRYPFSDWKNLFILGILVVFNSLGVGSNDLSSLIPLIIGFVIYLLISGYTFRIIKTSLKGSNKLPKFNAWISMIKDAVKVLIVGVVYLIPIMVLAIIFSKVILVYTTLGILEGTPLGILVNLLGLLLVSFLNGKISSVLAVTGLSLYIAIAYFFIIIPIYYVAIANMANNDGKLSTAFKLGEILNKIRNIGFKKFLIFYVLLIPLLIIFWLVHLNIIYVLLLGLIITIYLKVFIYRSVALVYINDEKTVENVK